MLHAREGWVWDTEEPLLSLLSPPLGQGVGVGEERSPFPVTFEKGGISLTLTEIGPLGTLMNSLGQKNWLGRGQGHSGNELCDFWD